MKLGGVHISGFVSIMRGCNNFCTYCIVPYTRGRERSRDIESILNEIRDMRDKGFKEVTLLGQNVNSYLFEKEGEKISFPALLKRVAEEVPEMRVRFTTSHPKDMSDETLHVIAEHDNICKMIHLPAQSGSSRILKVMNRKYTRDGIWIVLPLSVVSCRTVLSRPICFAVFIPKRRRIIKKRFP